MKVYLIRHCETVDNVAGLYAGSRDSAPTVHGIEQARRLGEYLGGNGKGEGQGFTRIYASNLQRAWKTAEAVRDACAREGGGEMEVIRVEELREQDFGGLEGRKWGEERRKDEDEGDMAVEGKEAMAARADKFLSDHIMPLFGEGEAGADEHVVAVVSHGMLLSYLWRRLLARLPRNSVSIAPEITAARGAVVLEHLGAWSNTGYLELEFRRKSGHRSSEAPNDSGVLHGWSSKIIAINSRQHLNGLKKQRGGIGSLAHDEGQRKLDGFFTKRQKFG